MSREPVERGTIRQACHSGSGRVCHNASGWTGRRSGWITGLAIALASAVTLSLAACMITPAQRREETLARETHMFNDDLRWSRYEQAAKALPADEIPLFLGRANLIGEELVWGDSDVVSITFGTPSTTAVSVVKVDWYYRRDQIVKSTTLEQRWQFADEHWTMIKQRRLRGERFPLVTEPVAAIPAH